MKDAARAREATDGVLSTPSLAINGCRDTSGQTRDWIAKVDESRNLGCSLLLLSLVAECSRVLERRSLAWYDVVECGWCGWGDVCTP